MIYENVNNRLLEGASKLARVVGCTMGPRGETVIINRLSDNPSLTKDGVTVARNIELEDKVENIAVRIIKEVALNVVDEAGDGTTTATVLAEALFSNGKACLSDKSISATELKKNYKEWTEEIVKILEANSIKITEDNNHLLRQVATISANNDAELGDVIYDAITQVGIDGIVRVKESNTNSTTVSIENGCNYANGFLNTYFITNSANGKAELKEPQVVLIDKKLEDAREVESILMAIDPARPILFIASDYSAEIISMLVVNNQNKIRKICAIKATEFGDYRKDAFKDYALITGARICDALKPFSSAKDLGKLKSAIVTKKEHTLFVDKDVENHIKDEILPAHIELLKERIESLEDSFSIGKIKSRIAKLTGGIAIINVGAKSELELRERLDRIEDSLLATQAAIKEGIVPGGGIALFKAMVELVKRYEDTEDVSLAIMLTNYAFSLAAPLNCIMTNAGYDMESEETEIAMTRDLINGPKDFFYGYNIATSNNTFNLVSLLDEGVIDPLLVTKSALTNAVSVASLLMTTNNVVEHFDLNTPYYGG